MDFIVVQASSTPTSPHLPGLPTASPPLLPLTAACTVALDAAAAAEVNVQFESAPRMCFASQALQQRVCPCVCVRVSVYAFILIYYGHGFFGTKICLLYKKRKQRQANKKSRTTVRGRGPSGPVPESRCHCQNREQTPSTLTHTHTLARGHTPTHTLV